METNYAKISSTSLLALNDFLEIVNSTVAIKDAHNELLDALNNSEIVYKKINVKFAEMRKALAEARVRRSEVSRPEYAVHFSLRIDRLRLANMRQEDHLEIDKLVSSALTIVRSDIVRKDAHA